MSQMLNEVPEGVSLDHVNAVILVADENGEIIYANEALKRIYKLEPLDVLGDGWWNITSESPEEAISRKHNMAKMARGEVDLALFNLHEKFYKIDGNEANWTQWTHSRIPGNKIIGVAQDITEKKILREELNQKIRENELLLREVYHRVKNNLQIILSLLKLEFEQVVDITALNALKKTTTRIYSMSLIHNELCESNTIAHRNFLLYLDNLLGHIFELYSNNKDIELKSTYACRSLNTEISVNLGLIITELVSNSLQHAFPSQNQGSIHVSLEEMSNGKNSLIVTDNGVGMDMNFDPFQSSTLGFEIITSLVEQIDGTLDIVPDDGTKVLIHF